MMTPKEYLRSVGIDASGRGRMSRENVAKVEAAVASGIAIKGYAVAAPVSGTPVSPSTPVEVKKVANNVKEVLEFTILHDEREFKAIDANGKEHTMRWVCNNCKVSLVQCTCGAPTIIGNVAVTIVPR